MKFSIEQLVGAMQVPLNQVKNLQVDPAAPHSARVARVQSAERHIGSIIVRMITMRVDLGIAAIRICVQL